MNYNAFISEMEVKRTTSGKLVDKTFAVKDVFDIKGIPASAGNPDWLKSHEPANSNAPVVEQLLAEGAALLGTTITDELMYSLNGENMHYGTPVNPVEHTRVPGGSSSGSAVAVAANMVDFSLGTDTGGSIRIPAAYCGNFGFRPTHGSVRIDGAIPLASSFDTVGWMTKDPALLHLVGQVIVKGDEHRNQAFDHVFLGEDCWELVSKGMVHALKPYVHYVESELTATTGNVAKEGLMEWSNVFRTLQGLEIWKTHGEWIEKVQPEFAPDIRARFQWASALDPSLKEPNERMREEITEAMQQLLGDHTILLIPTTPDIAPKLHLSENELEDRRTKTMQLTCIAGLAKLPQVTLPLGHTDGIPTSLSVVAGQGMDLPLLKWVKKHWPALSAI
ncbi:amidase [Evansella cellulosilytica]|uniref:Amidase n=1 Tax=Evansella cellulosilytica (strain ATCC 21833 / DSM 2522 / FERM P-1141 / JCM 9156 / N-4) TaxID=649639 RepID=E6U1B7_EVAC2|nr:amidase [Evansella cellulosilytica]ADU29164.1 Amidase [Evansella cellulosilytica DSM 2522]